MNLFQIIMLIVTVATLAYTAYKLSTMDDALNDT